MCVPGSPLFTVGGVSCATPNKCNDHCAVRETEGCPSGVDESSSEVKCHVCQNGYYYSEEEKNCIRKFHFLTLFWIVQWMIIRFEAYKVVSLLFLLSSFFKSLTNSIYLSSWRWKWQQNFSTSVLHDVKVGRRIKNVLLTSSCICIKSCHQLTLAKDLTEPPCCSLLC